MGYSSSGCACTASENVAAISRSLTFYTVGNVPTHEIDQVISWLDEVKKDCDRKISGLKAIQAERERVKAWRENINAIAHEFCDRDSIHLDFKTRLDIVEQKLGKGHPQARRIADTVQKWAAREILEKKHKNIHTDILNGLSASYIAKKHDISRQQVYNIKKKFKKRLIR